MLGGYGGAATFLFGLAGKVVVAPQEGRVQGVNRSLSRYNLSSFNIS